MMSSDKIVTLTDDNFDDEVLRSDIPVLVDFWAEWCGPCRMLAPTIDALAEKYHGKIKVAKLNTDQSPRTAMRFSVMSIPTVIFFKGGSIAAQQIGAASPTEYERIVSSL